MVKGRVFILSGPSGAGKGSICKEIIEDIDDLVFSISMTTRPIRKGEVHGENYYFATEEEFKDIKENNGFLEYAQVYENYYGTPKDKVLEAINSGNDVVLEIDIQGAMKIKESYPDGIFIFILPPSMMELRRRITSRGTESKKTIELRMREALREISYINKYDYCVVNKDLREATNRVKAIIIAEHSRVSEDIYKLVSRYKEEI